MFIIIIQDESMIFFKLKITVALEDNGYDL